MTTYSAAGPGGSIAHYNSKQIVCERCFVLFCFQLTRERTDIQTHRHLVCEKNYHLFDRAWWAKREFFHYGTRSRDKMGLCWYWELTIPHLTKDEGLGLENIIWSLWMKACMCEKKFNLSCHKKFSCFPIKSIQAWKITKLCHTAFIYGSLHNSTVVVETMQVLRFTARLYHYLHSWNVINRHYLRKLFWPIWKDLEIRQ